MSKGSNKVAQTALASGDPRQIVGYLSSCNINNEDELRMQKGILDELPDSFRKMSTMLLVLSPIGILMGVVPGIMLIITGIMMRRKVSRMKQCVESGVAAYRAEYFDETTTKAQPAT